MYIGEAICPGEVNSQSTGTILDTQHEGLGSVVIGLSYQMGYICCALITDSFAGYCSTSLIARFMGPTWGPSGADRAQVGPMSAPWTLLSGSQQYVITTFIFGTLIDNVINLNPVDYDHPYTVWHFQFYWWSITCSILQPLHCHLHEPMILFHWAVQRVFCQGWNTF